MLKQLVDVERQLAETMMMMPGLSSKHLTVVILLADGPNQIFQGIKLKTALALQDIRITREKKLIHLAISNGRTLSEEIAGMIYTLYNKPLHGGCIIGGTSGSDISGDKNEKLNIR